MNIRLVEEKDLVELSEIFIVAYNSIDIGERWDEESALKLMHWLYREQKDLFYCAEEDGKLLGAVVGIIKPWWDGNHITDGEIFVDPRSQKKGTGTKLLKKLLSKGKEKHNAKSWDTFTHVLHEHPMSWYKKMGFSKINEWQMISGDIDKVIEVINKKNKHD